VPGTALRELLDHRELFRQIVRRDLRVRYKQAVLGIGWAILAPFLTMLVFTVVFTRAVRVETEVPYPLFAYSGLLAWTLLASALRSATTSLTGNHALVTKVRFPRSILPLAAVTVSLVDFLVAAAMLGGLMVFYGVAPGPGLALLPVVLLAQLSLVSGLALLLAMANLFYRDVGLVFGLVLTLWMFLTPVVYPVELIGGRLGAALTLNPMNPLLEAFRAALFGGALPRAALVIYAVTVSVAVLVGAVTLFHRLEPRIAEVI
jgi:ABC-type polysaccharide/polyol phosphate export permease